MSVILHYTEEEKVVLPEVFLQAVAEETLKRCTLFSLAFLAEKKEIALNAISVSSTKIQQLNRTYRGKDQVTDILSFGEYADTRALRKEKAEKIFLGELFFCGSFIAQAAEEDQVTFQHEMAYIFSHGILHLLGFDHSRDMFALQDAVTERWLSPVREA